MREAPMRLQRKKALTAVAVLTVFAVSAVPLFADEAGRTCGQTSTSSAEFYLTRLSTRSRRARTVAGGIGAALGTVCLAAGAAELNDGDEGGWLCLEDAFAAMAVAMGGAVLAASALYVIIPSSTERAYKRIRRITDPAEKEAACADALARLARKGRTKRMIGGALFGAAGIIYALSSGSFDDQSAYLASAGLTAGISAYFLLVKSRAERANRAYLKQSQVKPIPDLILGFGPRGSFRAGLSLNF
jgi:hypothetical protein